MKTREQIQKEIEELQKQLSESTETYDNLLEDSEFYYYGSLRGVEDVEDLEDFLKGNSEWILKMMGWEEINK